MCLFTFFLFTIRPERLIVNVGINFPLSFPWGGIGYDDEVWIMIKDMVEKGMSVSEIAWLT